MTAFDIKQHAHRRYNPLLDEWILVSPQRTQRPWQGQQETATPLPTIEYDANCYLCPGNTRSNGEINPNYESCFVFSNDFPAFQSQEFEAPLNHKAQLHHQQLKISYDECTSYFMRSAFIFIE